MASRKPLVINAGQIEQIQSGDTLDAVDEKVKVDAGATAGYLGAAADDGVLRVDGALSYADGGDNVTLGGSASKMKAHPSSAQDIPPSSTVKVILGTVDFDPESNFASSTYTAPATGYYLVCGRVGIGETITAGAYLQATVLVNGVNMSNKRSYSSGSLTVTAFASGIFYVESGQSIELWVRQSHASNRLLNPGVQQTSLDIHRLS